MAKYPAPFGAVPSAAQISWQETQLTALIHFSVNTFTDKEWGYGDEPVQTFNPSAFDADQIAGVIADAGMRGLILVCKHHDGFCLWPTKTTEHCIRNSPWKNGKGDIVREFADAARKHGLKFGTYLSPWDRNHPAYGKPEYTEVYRRQFEELVTGYGPLFELWFDGANGGDGYYGGAREMRKIDKTTYYQWEKIWALARKFQPDACMFSDAGPDIRWVGNEAGFSNETCWAAYTPHGGEENPDKPTPGNTRYLEGLSGHRDGKFWLPAECDFPLRPGWFFHASENDKVKSPGQLLERYFQSVGRGCNMNLGLAPDKRGLMHENDAASLRGFGKILRDTFASNLLAGANIEADNVRGGDSEFAALNVIDGDRKTYWATDDNKLSAGLVFTLKEPVEFNVFKVSEYLPLGQRMDAFAVDVWTGGKWREIASATSVGAQRLLHFHQVKTDKVRLRITKASAGPAISEVAAYAAPVILSEPVIERDSGDKIRISCANPGPLIKYTADGSAPDFSSPDFMSPFRLPKEGGTVRAFAYMPGDQSQRSAVVSMTFSHSEKLWKVTHVSSQRYGGAAENIFNDDIDRCWSTWAKDGSGKAPQSVTVSMGENLSLKGFTLTPLPCGLGLPSKYEFYVSSDGQEWQKAAAGEFANIIANPVKQYVSFEKPVSAGYFRLVILSAAGNGDHIVIACVGVTV